MRYWRLLFAGVAAACTLAMRLMCWPPVSGYPDRVVGSIVLPYGTAEAFAFAPSLDYAYIGCGVYDKVYRLRMSDLTITATIDVEGDPSGLAFTPDGQYCYVSCFYGGRITKIRTADDSIVAVLPVPSGPSAISIMPGGDRAYVTTCTPSTVMVLRLVDDVFTDTLPTGDNPGSALSPDASRLYIWNRYANTLTVMRTHDNAVIAVIPVGEMPHRAAPLPDGSKIYVTRYSSPVIPVVDAATNTVTDSVTVASGEFGIAALPPVGRYVYAASRYSSMVHIIRTSDNEVVDSLQCGETPCRIVPDPDGSRLFVCNRGIGEITIIGY